MYTLCILCTCIISMALLNKIRYETKQKSKCEVDFNFIFISLEKKNYFGIILTFFGKNPGTNTNFIAHVLNV